MKINSLFKQLKQWCLRVSVSSIMFMSVMLLGGTIITLALPSSLNDIKSTNANNQLTAENWDYLVAQVQSNVNSILNLDNKATTNATEI
ncbi:MAG: hypothetical protein LBG52_05370 [Candidatus Peribacteria bacterium]|jgi:predicted nucleic acid binding AN1-type Zn finger protein|nr:hypothetical protein [Candidatus Peribacteria bacterium]